MAIIQVLPDYRANNHGYVRDPMWRAGAATVPGDAAYTWTDARANQPESDLRGPEQVMTLNNERFTVPELLFNPSVRTPAKRRRWFLHSQLPSRVNLFFDAALRHPILTQVCGLRTLEWNKAELLMRFNNPYFRYP